MVPWELSTQDEDAAFHNPRWKVWWMHGVVAVAWLWRAEAGLWELVMGPCSDTEIWHFTHFSGGGSSYNLRATLAAGVQEEQGQSSLYVHETQSFSPVEAVICSWGVSARSVVLCYAKGWQLERTCSPAQQGRQPLLELEEVEVTTVGLQEPGEVLAGGGRQEAACFSRSWASGAAAFSLVGIQSLETAASWVSLMLQVLIKSSHTTLTYTRCC